MTETGPGETPSQRAFECPSCGHEISMFEEIEPDREEQLATRVADVVASLWFPVALAAIAIAWVLLNVIARPFDPYPMVMIGGLALFLTGFTAGYGPLILLAQRHAATRDRARDIETYLVASRSEADLHDLRERLTQLEATITQSAESQEPDD